MRPTTSELRYIWVILLSGIFCICSQRNSFAHSGDDSPNSIHACIASNETVRIVGVSGNCSRNETPIHWSIVGPVGPQGPKGDTGPQGLPGQGLETGAIKGAVAGCRPADAVISIPGRSFMAKANGLGQFELSYVPAGTYDIEIEIPGRLVIFVVTGVIVNTGQTTDVGTKEIPVDTEVCDGQDNDCDGSIDENFPQLGEACQSSGCVATGTYVCDSTGTGVQCNCPFS